MSAYRKGENIADFYKIEDELGAGSFGIVKLATNKSTGEEVAIKIIDRSGLQEDDEVALRNEVQILSDLDHPNVVKMIEVFDEEDF
mmetsp:Transcript_12131/g.10757  ORF Transcript_12131/g.10757 Transcript_12131/m.10757 type:complete len:86 (-) Transcript_12131:722-979(-)